MTISKVQNQTSFTQKPPVVYPQGNVSMERLLIHPSTHYRNAEGVPDSVNMIKPEAGQGHLIHDNIFQSIGRFFKNRIYDIKSVYKGYTGHANDYQLGRTNDVGLALGGIGIAAFLATKRTATMSKHMETVGLISFLTSMALWPKIGIFGPARLIHGFAPDKRYVDDQGRNKSVFQDPNYIPDSLYNGKRRGESFSVIADRMGISKDASNRDEMAKDLARKIAVQNNTLWMITSGVAVPTMTALLCNGFEKVYEPYLVSKKIRNNEGLLDGLYETVFYYNRTKENKILRDKVESKIKNNSNVANTINKFVKQNEGKTITTEHIKNLVNKICEGAPQDISAAFARDLTGMLQYKKAVIVDSEYIENLALNLERVLQGYRNLNKEIPTLDELKAAIPIKDGQIVHSSEEEILNKIKELVNNKYARSSNIPSNMQQKAQNLFRSVVDNPANKILPKSNKMFLSTDAAKTITSIAQPLETYISTLKTLNQINELKMGEAADSANANFWGRLEKTFTNIIYPKSLFRKDLKTLMDNPKAIEGGMRIRLEEIAKDEKLYVDVLKKIDALKVEYMKCMLGVIKDDTNGDESVRSIVQEYFKLIEDRSKWSLRKFSLYEGGTGLNIDKFIEIQYKIGDNLKNSLPKDFENLKMAVAAMGVKNNDKAKGLNQFKYIQYSTENTNHKILSVASREVEKSVNKIEEFVNACDRMIHSLDVYRRAYLYEASNKNAKHIGSVEYINTEWSEDIFNRAKSSLIAAKDNDVFEKYHTNNARMYQSYMNQIYNIAPGEARFMPEGKGYLDDLTIKTLGDDSVLTTQRWIQKYRNIIGHDEFDWQHVGYQVGNNNNYNDFLKTPEARYRLQGKNLVELANQGVKKAHNSGKWLKIFGGLFAGVYGASILAQLTFGKKDYTIPLEKDRQRNIMKSQATDIVGMEAKRVS